MLAALGGRRAWAEARSLRVELRGFYARESRPWTEVFWIDLESPRGRFELRGGDADRTIAWTPEGGWEERDGAVEPIPAARHEIEMEYWRRQPAVLLHQLAQGKVGFTPATEADEKTIQVVDLATAEPLARFTVNLQAEPTKWTTQLGEHAIDHLLGPLATFGEIRFPRWGGSVDGVWRYEHVSVEISPAPFDAPLEPPSAPAAGTDR